MGTKVTIFDVNLGNIEKMIENNIKELHGESKKRLDEAVEERKKLKELKQRKIDQQELSKRKIQKAIIESFELMQRNPDGVSSDDIMEIVKPYISTKSAFTTRMKSKLRQDGNQYRLDKKTKNKIMHYILIPAQ